MGPDPAQGASPGRRSPRRLGLWHRRLGYALFLPLILWMGTALAFVLWPIRTVRGTAASTGRTAPDTGPIAWALPPADRLAGASMVTLRRVEGHPVAVIDRGKDTELWDLSSRQSLGAVLPLPWAREAARRDFAGSYEEAAAYLFPRTGSGFRVAGTGPDSLDQPEEYAGPRPAYAFHLRPGNTRLYVDALSGEVRARRNAIWRFYDLAFRLHSFEFTRDGIKRTVLGAVVSLWFALGATGLLLAARGWRKRSPDSSPRRRGQASS